MQVPPIGSRSWLTLSTPTPRRADYVPSSMPLPRRSTPAPRRGRGLAAAGFSLLAEVDAFPAERGRYYMIRGGSLIAWSSEAASGPATPFRVVGAHTDSPNLRIKPQPDLTRAGWQLLGIESYGGPLFNSWLARALGLWGLGAVRSDDGVQPRLVPIEEPVLRVAQL